jgi:hypothetical protein
MAAGTLPLPSHSLSETLALMHLTPADAAVAAAGCAALVRLTGGTGRSEERVRTLAVLGVRYSCRLVECMQQGAPAALVAALQLHTAQESVCAPASLALRNLAYGLNGHEAACVAAGALPALVAVLLAHAQSTATCALACGAIRNIAADAACAEAAVEAGVVPQLAAALCAHASSAALCEQALAALANITEKSRRGPAQDACALAMPAIAQAMEQQQGSRQLCSMCLRVVRATAALGDAQQASRVGVLLAGGARGLLVSMFNNTTSPSLAGEINAALQALGLQALG